MNDFIMTGFTIIVILFQLVHVREIFADGEPFEQRDG